MQKHFEFCTQKSALRILRYSAQLPSNTETEEEGSDLKPWEGQRTSVCPLGQNSDHYCTSYAEFEDPYVPQFEWTSAASVLFC